MKLIAYLRVSTDDKGQDPDRQKRVIQAWAATNKHEVTEFVKDEGTSGATPPLNRQAVREALQLAEDTGADGIVVESTDRWTRGGWQDLGVSMFLMQTEHGGKKLIIADLPQGDEFVAELLGGIMASVAKEFRRRLRAQIKSGLANAKAKGWPNGEPGRLPKPDLTDEELKTVNLCRASGMGWRRSALEISKGRGAYDVADPKAQKERAISQTWLRKEIARLASHSETRQYRPAGSPNQVAFKGERA